MFVVTFIFDDRFHIEKENYFLRSNVFYSPDQSVLDLFLLAIHPSYHYQERVSFVAVLSFVQVTDYTYLGRASQALLTSLAHH